MFESFFLIRTSAPRAPSRSSPFPPLIATLLLLADSELPRRRVNSAIANRPLEPIFPSPSVSLCSKIVFGEGNPYALIELCGRSTGSASGTVTREGLVTPRIEPNFRMGRSSDWVADMRTVAFAVGRRR